MTIGIGVYKFNANLTAATILGPIAGEPGQAATFTLRAADASPIDQAAAFTYQIDWNGDGVVGDLLGGIVLSDHLHPALLPEIVRHGVPCDGHQPC